jgi:small subunit ribosomal protein S9
VTEPTSTEYPEEGQPVTTPEPTIEAMEAVEEAAVEAESEAAVESEVEAEVEADAVADDVEADAVADDVEAEVGTAAEIPVVFTERPVQTVGRRKEAIVRVRLMPGTGKFTLNGKSLETYFPNKLHQQLIREPLVTVEKTERFDIFANLQGGGTSGQAGALRLAIARALIEVDAEDRPSLKRAGFLTRDARATERKKYGLKKARKAPQYSKR